MILKSIDILKEKEAEFKEKSASYYETYKPGKECKLDINRLFLPYEEFRGCIVEEDYDNYQMIPDKDGMTFDGIYIGYIHALRQLFEELTGIQFISKRDYAHGICDNATQIYELYKNMIESKNRFFMFLLTPLFQEDTANFKWSRSGKYIGEHTMEHELFDDEKFKFVYRYTIFELDPSTIPNK